MYVIVVGGGQVGTYLARRLQAEGRECLLIEKDPSQETRLRGALGDVVVIGDGCEAATQKAAGFERADVVAAVTGEDEDNLIVCQMATHTWGVERTVAWICGLSHIREAVAFPRQIHRLYP